MKIREIGRLIRDAGQCVIATSERGKQWIGTAAAIYPVDGVKIGRESVAALFDLSAKEQDSIFIEETRLEELDVYPRENRSPNWMEETGIELGSELLALKCGGRAYLLEKRKIKAALANDDYRQYLLGVSRSGQPVIIVHDGMIFAAAIYPLPLKAAEGIMEGLRGLSALEADGVGREEQAEAPQCEQTEMEA